MENLPQGLHYSRFSIREYLDKISSNYENKLPLVFGKWKLIKNILGVFSVYNFDVVLHRDMRSGDFDNLSILRGGNRELYYGIREIVLQTRQQLGDFANAGSYVWLNYPTEMTYKYTGRKDQYKAKPRIYDNKLMERPSSHKIQALMKKLTEVIVLLNPLECAFSKLVSSPSGLIRDVSSYLEELFANEVTAYYYFHLYYDYEFHTLFRSPAKYYDSVKDKRTNFPKSARPKFCLFSILEKDQKAPLIKEWFNQLMQNVIMLNKETYESLKLKM